MAGFNMQGLMRQAQQMQQKIKEAQEELEQMELIGSAGSRLVKVTVNGKKVISFVNIDPKAVDTEDMEMLEDLIIAAINDAYSQADEAYKEKMGAFEGIGGLV